MKKIRTAAVALALVSFAGACGEAVTGPAAAPGSAVFDGGLTLGSGHRSGSDSTSTGTTAAGTTEDPGSERGGLTLGSGH